MGLIKSFKRQTWRFSGIWNLNRKWRGVGEFSHFQIRTGPGGSQTETPPPLQVSQVSTDRNNNKNLKKEFVLWLSDLPSRGCLDSLLYLREFPSPKFAKTYKDLITRVFFFFFFWFVAGGTCCRTTRKSKQKFTGVVRVFSCFVFYHPVGSIWWVIRSPEGEEIRVFQHKPSHGQTKMSLFLCK